MSSQISVSIVEDDESLRLALVGLIRSLGHNARGFGSAEEFLEKRDGPCNCVITDIQMPGLSGIEMTRKLRESGYEAPVIMITARTEAALEQQAYASGALCVLHKPFETGALLHCLERALAA